MMDKKEQEFLKRLRETFRVEADEHLRALSSGLIELEKMPGPAERVQIIETVYREAHSLKGAARSVNLKEIESLCQPLESSLGALKRNEISLSVPLFDLFHQAVDSLMQLAASMDAERSPAERATLHELGRWLEEAAQGGGPQTAGPTPEGKTMSLPEATKSSLPQARSDDLSRPGKGATEVAAARLRVRSDGRSDDLSRRSKKAGVVEEKPPIRAPVASASPAKLAVARPDPYMPELELAAPNTPSMPKTVVVRPVDEAILSTSETVRIPINRLDPLLLQAEEMIQAKLAGDQRTTELRQIQEALVSWKIDWVKWKAAHPAQASQMPEWETSRLDTLEGRISLISQVFEQDQRSLRQMVDDHLEAMKQVLMLPVSILVEVFPRLVRDLAREQGKEVDLELSGMELEMDKRILEDLKDPLIHLVRNCVDHGIELPEKRRQQGKRMCGTLVLAFSAKDSRHMEILVSDDGAGIDLVRVRAAAERVGILSGEAAGKLDDQETLPLIFQSGVSTSEIITDLSGRGLGLAIVREKVEKLGGSVSVETHPGAGTTFRLLMPLTMATFRGVLVKARKQTFLLPSAHIERVLRVRLDEIQTVENRATILLGGKILSLVRLGDVLELPLRNNGGALNDEMSHQRTATEIAPADHVPVLILVSAQKRIAVQVDEVLAEEEILVKGLGQQLRRVRNIAGATVLGAGTIIPVINVADLIDSAIRPDAAVGTPEEEKNSVHTHHLLVAEDSITARTLLKNILETGGYQVTTAVDGSDAFTQLRSGEFDLLVSDVDMPRMSGFELTTKIREDKKLAELPVVLVTALESRADRERGIEVGANAYIIKSSFDQSNLLEVIQRLL